MVKVSFPKEQKFILDLIRYYQNAEQKLIRIIAEKEAKGTVTAYSRSLLAQVEREISKMNEYASTWASDNLPNEYKKGIKSAVNTYATLGAEIGSVESFSKLNTRNINLIVRNTQEDLINANNFIGRTIRDDLRQAGIEAIAQKELTGLTVKQTKTNLINTLIDRNVMAIKTRNGRNMNISAYAETVARSTSREAQNRGLLDTVTTSNRDLVKMSSHLTTCPVCGPLQGRVYSISGNSTEYPPLENAYGGVHANVHPNCRHVLMPYIPELDEDNEKVKAFSNRSFDIDSRSKSQIDNYNKQQKTNAERNRDRRQWERYKTSMLDKTPKTFSGFRKSKQSNSAKWQDLQSEYRSLRAKGEISAVKVKPKPKPRTIEKPKPKPFVPAKTIDEAIEKGKQFAKSVDYGKLELESINEINKSLEKLFNDKVPRLSELQAVSKRSKIFKGNGDTVMGSYDFIYNRFFINEGILKNQKTLNKFKKEIQKGKEAVENMTQETYKRLSGKTKEFIDNYRKIGRNLVDGDTIEGIITHEMGHHVDFTVLRKEYKNIDFRNDYEIKSKKISTYAGSNGAEYIAESYTAYHKGEKNILDKKFVNVMDKIYK